MRQPEELVRSTGLHGFESRPLRRPKKVLQKIYKIKKVFKNNKTNKRQTGNKKNAKNKQRNKSRKKRNIHRRRNKKKIQNRPLIQNFSYFFCNTIEGMAKKSNIINN